MKLILRGDLRCPHKGCNAPVIEFQDAELRPTHYRCKVHGIIQPATKGHVGIPPRAGPPPAEESARHRYPDPAPCRQAAPPPDEAPAPYATGARA